MIKRNNKNAINDDRESRFNDAINTFSTKLPIYEPPVSTMTEHPFARLYAENATIMMMITRLFLQPNTQVEKSDLIDIHEAGELLKMSTSTIYKLTSKHEIPFFKRVGSNKLNFSRCDLQTWLKQNQTPTTNLVEEHLHKKLRVRKNQNN